MLDPDEHVVARIEARRQREIKLEEDAATLHITDIVDSARDSFAEANRKGNAWTSKTKPSDL